MKHELNAVKELFSKEFRTQGHFTQFEATFNKDSDWVMQSDITNFLNALDAEDVTPAPEPMKLLNKVGIQRVIAMLKQAADKNYNRDHFLKSLTRLLNLLNTPENCAIILNEISTAWLLTILDRIIQSKHAADLLICLASKAKDKFLEILEAINSETLSIIVYSDAFVIKTLECLPENKRYDFLMCQCMKRQMLRFTNDLTDYVRDKCLPIFTYEQRYLFLNEYIPPNNNYTEQFMLCMLPTVKNLYECKLPEGKKAEFISRMFAWDLWVSNYLCRNLMELDEKTLADNLAYLDLQTLIKIYKTSLKSSSQAVAIAIIQIAAAKETKHTDSSTNNLMQFYQATALINDQLKEVVIKLTPETREKLYDAFIHDLKLKTQAEPTKEWVVSAKNLVKLFKPKPVTQVEFINLSINTGVDYLFKIWRALPSSFPEYRLPFLKRLDVELLKRLFNLSDERHLINWLPLIVGLVIHEADKLIQAIIQLAPEKLAMFIAVPGVLDLLLSIRPKEQQAKIDLCRTMSVTAEWPEDHKANTETRRFLT